MELFRVIRRDARCALRFCGGRAAACVLIIFLAYLAISLTESILLFVFAGMESLYLDYAALSKISPEVLYISGGSAAVYIFVISALAFGHTKLHFAFAEGKDENITMLFDGFSSLKRLFGCIFFYLGYGIRAAVSLAAAAIPGTAIFYAAWKFIPESGRTIEILRIAVCCIAVAVVILCLSLALIFIQRWALAEYYYVNGSGIIKSFSLSAKAAKGLCTTIIKFKLSFFGWALVSLFILPLLWSVPYYSVAKAIFAKYLMERYERSLAEVPGESEEDFTPA